MKKIMAVVLSLVAFTPVFALAANLWELRDGSNVSQVQIDASKLLIGATLNATSITTGSLPDARLSANVTLQSNTFNGVSQLIQTTAAGKYPALDGSLITSIVASQVAAAGVQAGSLGSGVIASSVAAGTINSAAQIVDATITGAKLANNTLTNAQMAVGTFANITVPAANVAAGSLGASVIASSVAVGAVLDASIVSVTGSKVSGNISGNAANITGNLPAAQVAAGTLSGSFTFSSSLVVNGLTDVGAQTAVALRTLACASSACLAFNSTDFDLYTSTGATAGSWRNSRTGTAP